jgi:hypothetical protein
MTKPTKRGRKSKTEAPSVPVFGKDFVYVYKNDIAFAFAEFLEKEKIKRDDLIFALRVSMTAPDWKRVNKSLTDGSLSISDAALLTLGCAMVLQRDVSLHEILHIGAPSQQSKEAALTAFELTEQEYFAATYREGIDLAKAEFGDVKAKLSEDIIGITSQMSRYLKALEQIRSAL